MRGNSAPSSDSGIGVYPSPGLSAVPGEQAADVQSVTLKNVKIRDLNPTRFHRLDLKRKVKEAPPQVTEDSPVLPVLSAVGPHRGRLDTDLGSRSFRSFDDSMFFKKSF